ncbi:MAG: DUF2157 domain-containing protein [Planctomycetota bacterium]
MNDAVKNGDPSRDILSQPAGERAILDLHAARLLSAEARDAALTALRPEQHWWRWANRSLLFVGAALFLAGVIFFFAYNWARMHAVSKFCVVETGLWICAVGAMRSGLEKITGKVLLLSASMLVGVLLAVYGQVYQTGADAYENYVFWALLIVPWVIVGRFGALWVLWLVVSNVAMILFWIQVDIADDFEFVFGIFLLLAAWNGTALAGRELGASRGLSWLSGRWIRHLIWLSILVYLTIPAFVFVVEPDFDNGSLAGAIGLAVVLVAGHAYFRHIQPDLLSFAFNVLAFCFMLLTVIGKVLFEVSDGAFAFLAFGVIVLGISSAAAFYLRLVARSIADDATN